LGISIGLSNVSFEDLSQQQDKKLAKFLLTHRRFTKTIESSIVVLLARIEKNDIKDGQKNIMNCPLLFVEYISQ
jgi:hypothetical protein